MWSGKSHLLGSTKHDSKCLYWNNESSPKTEWYFHPDHPSETYSSAVLFFPTFLYFYVHRRLVMFLDPGELALCGGCPMYPRCTLPRKVVVCFCGHGSLGCPDCNFLSADVGPLVGKAGLEACVGFLVGAAQCHPLVGGADSWLSVSRASQVKGHF